MGDAIQNIKIKYTIEGNFDKAEAELKTLNKEEQELVHNFNDVNKAAKATGDTIAKESKEASNNTNKVSTSVTGLQTKFGSLKNVISSGFSVDSIKQFSGEMINVGTSVGKTSAMFNILKVAIIGTGIGALIVALGSVYAYFTQTEEGGDRLARIMAVIGVFTKKLINVFSDLGGVIIDGLVYSFELFIATVEIGLTVLARMIKDMAVLADAVGLDGLAGKMNAASEVIGGVFNQMAGMTEEAIRLGEALADLQDEVEALTAVYKVQNAEFNKVIENNLRALKNRNITYSEAIKLIDEIDKASSQTLNNEIDLNNKNIEAWRLASLAKVNDKDELNRLFDLYKGGGITVSGFVQELNKFIDVRDQAGSLKQEDVTAVSDLLAKQVQYETEYGNIQERIENIKDTQAEKDRARREKAYADELKSIQDREKLTIKFAHLEGATEQEITSIKREALDERIKLMEDYNKQETFEYKNALLDRQQLDLEYQKTLIKTLDASGIQKIKIRQDEIDKERAMMEEQSSFALAKIKEQADADKAADAEKLARKQELEAKIQELLIQAANTAFTIRKNQLAAELTAIETRKNAEIAEAGNSKQAIAIINEKFAKEEAAVKRKQAIVDRNQALFNIALSGAQGAAKTIASVGLPAAIPLLLVEAGIIALQSAAVLSKPIPKFNKGTRSVPGTDYGTDSVLAMLRPGEAVIPVDQNRGSKKLIDGIISGKIDDRVLAMNYGGIEKSLEGISIKQDMSGLEIKMDQINSTLKKLKVAEIHMDKKGLRSFLREDGSNSEFMNNYFRN